MTGDDFMAKKGNYNIAVAKAIRCGLSAKDVQAIMFEGLERYDDSRVDAIYCQFCLALNKVKWYDADELTEVCVAVDEMMKEFLDDNNPKKYIEDMKKELADRTGLWIGEEK